ITIKNESGNNLIQYNDFYHVNLNSDDTGVIELNKPGRGNVIQQNRVHDSEIHFSFGFGIYLDDSSSGVTVSHNLVDGLQKTGAGELEHAIFAKGVDNNITNNFLVNNHANIGPFRSSSENSNLVVERNVFHNSGDTVYRFH